MKLKTKTITVYTADDGSEHTDHMSAVMVDLFVMFKLAHGEDMMDADMAANTVFNNREKLADLFRSYNKIEGQKKPRSFEKSEE